MCKKIHIHAYDWCQRIHFKLAYSCCMIVVMFMPCGYCLADTFKVLTWIIMLDSGEDHLLP
jgi:hypothetical protein